MTVSLTSTDDEAVTLSPASLLFTSQNWETAQEVTVQSLQDDDALDEAVTVTATAAAPGTDHDGATRRVEVSVIDDDGAELILSVETLDVTEGGGVELHGGPGDDPLDGGDG